MADLPQALCFAIDALKDSIQQVSQIALLSVHMQQFLQQQGSGARGKQQWQGQKRPWVQKSSKTRAKRSLWRDAPTSGDGKVAKVFKSLGNRLGPVGHFYSVSRVQAEVLKFFFKDF